MTRPYARVAARVPVAGGEGRVLASGATERTLEIELAGRTSRQVWDPRETGPILFARLDAWTEPGGAALTPDDRERVLDALWQLAPRTGGVRAVVEWVGAIDGCVAWRWDRGADGALVRVRPERVDVLELGRTARVGCVTTSAADGAPIARVDPATARWVYPRPEPLDDEAWARVWSHLSAARDADYILTDHGWRFVSDGATASR